MKTFFEPPLTDDELYWAGVIHADGSVSYERKRVVLGQKDRHMLEEFLKFLGQDSKITEGYRKSQYGESFVYQASTRKGVEGLKKLGVKREIVPELYASRHFWRGLIDGDGGLTVNKAGYPFVYLCSGKGPRDVVAFSEWVGVLFGAAGPKPYLDKKGVWYAYIGAGRARLLGPYLYEDGYSAVPRKRDLALSFREIWTQSKVRLIRPD